MLWALPRALLVFDKVFVESLPRGSRQIILYRELFIESYVASSRQSLCQKFLDLYRGLVVLSKEKIAKKESENGTKPRRSAVRAWA
jgi:hypothetical protein